MNSARSVHTYQISVRLLRHLKGRIKQNIKWDNWVETHSVRLHLHNLVQKQPILIKRAKDLVSVNKACRCEQVCTPGPTYIVMRQPTKLNFYSYIYWLCIYNDGIFQGPSTCIVSVPVSVTITITIKVYHYVNDDGPLDKTDWVWSPFCMSA